MYATNDIKNSTTIICNIKWNHWLCYSDFHSWFSNEITTFLSYNEINRLSQAIQQQQQLQSFQQNKPQAWTARPPPAIYQKPNNGLAMTEAVSLPLGVPAFRPVPKTYSALSTQSPLAQNSFNKKVMQQRPMQIQVCRHGNWNFYLNKFEWMIWIENLASKCDVCKTCTSSDIRCAKYSETTDRTDFDTVFSASIPSSSTIGYKNFNRSNSSIRSEERLQYQHHLSIELCKAWGEILSDLTSVAHIIQLPLSISGYQSTINRRSVTVHPSSAVYEPIESAESGPDGTHCRGIGGGCQYQRWCHTKSYSSEAATASGRTTSSYVQTANWSDATFCHHH